MPCPQLPNEILQLIVSHIAGSDDSIAVPASHIITKTLHSLLFVCKATSGASVEQLHRRCLFIDSPWRLGALVRSYTSRTPIPGRSVDPTIFRQNASAAMFLKISISDMRSGVCIVPLVRELFGMLSENLRRLIVDIADVNFTSIGRLESPEGDFDIRSAFRSLIAVEEFVNIGDQLCFETTTSDDDLVEAPVWSEWKRLRRLALFELELDPASYYGVGQHINAMPKLQSVMLVRPYSFPNLMSSVWDWNAAVRVGYACTWREHTPWRRLMLQMHQTRNFGGDTTTVLRTYRSMPAEESADCSSSPFLDIFCIHGQSTPGEAPDFQGDQHFPLLSSADAHVFGNDTDEFVLGIENLKSYRKWMTDHAQNGEIWRELERDGPPSEMREAPENDGFDWRFPASGDAEDW